MEPTSRRTEPTHHHAISYAAHAGEITKLAAELLRVPDARAGLPYPRASSATDHELDKGNGSG
jgi:hypothetical protein